MADAKLEIQIRATDEASKSFQEIEGNLKKLRDTTKAVGVAMTAAGGAIVGGALLSVKSYAEMGSAIHDLALKTGFSTEAVSEWKYALEQSGGDASDLQMAIKTMSNVIVDANNGAVDAQRVFDALGLKYQDLINLAPEEQFAAIASAVGEIENPTTRAATAQDTFGRSAQNLLPLLAEGKDGIAALRDQAHDLGVVFDQEAADKADAFGDTLSDLGTLFDGLKNTIGGFLADSLKPVIDGTTAAMSGFNNWAKNNPEWSSLITKLGTSVGVVAGALGSAMLFLPSVVSHFREFSKLTKTSLASFTLLGVAVTEIATAFMMLFQQLDKEGQWAEDERRLVEEQAKALQGLANEYGVVSEAVTTHLQQILDSGMLNAQEKAQLESITQAIRDQAAAYQELANLSQGLTSTPFSSLSQVERERMTPIMQEQATSIVGARGSSASSLANMSAEEFMLWYMSGWVASGNVKGMASGGAIDEPTLLYGLRSQRPYALAGEAGREYVTPSGGNTFTIINEIDGHVISRIVAEQLGRELKVQGIS